MMKSPRALVPIALLFLILAVGLSVSVYADISSPVKIALFALGFGCGVALGGFLVTKRLT